MKFFSVDFIFLAVKHYLINEYIYNINKEYNLLRLK